MLTMCPQYMIWFWTTNSITITIVFYGSVRGAASPVQCMLCFWMTNSITSVWYGSKWQTVSPVYVMALRDKQYYQCMLRFWETNSITSVWYGSERLTVSPVYVMGYDLRKVIIEFSVSEPYPLDTEIIFDIWKIVGNPTLPFWGCLLFLWRLFD